MNKFCYITTQENTRKCLGMHPFVWDFICLKHGEKVVIDEEPKFNEATKQFYYDGSQTIKFKDIETLKTAQMYLDKCLESKNIAEIKKYNDSLIKKWSEVKILKSAQRLAKTLKDYIETFVPAQNQPITLCWQ